MTNTVILFPGQGSQCVGMGADFYNAYSLVRELFEHASDIVKLDLKSLCFTGPADALKETINVQPAVTLVNAACYEVLKKEGFSPVATAGHSLGEYAALYAAGSIGFETMMALVKERGEAMQKAADEHPGGMLAVMGLGFEAVQGICGEASSAGSIEVANHNTPTQIILTGEAPAIERARVLAKEAKAKFTIPLKVSGPWHSRFMAPAAERMAAVLEAADINEARIPVVANVTADYESTPVEIRSNLLKQITSPVLWTGSIERLIKGSNTHFVEAGPGRVLKGLLRDINRDVTAFSVQDTKTLDKLLRP